MRGESTIEAMSLHLAPRSVVRPADAGSTVVAGLDGPPAGRVDGGGAVEPAGAPWSVDWWIGADDRWHTPSAEPTVRQRRLGHGPVVETAVRIPGGDAVHTAYPVAVGGVQVVAVEVRNESPVPVALAVAVRPVRLDGRSPSAALELGLASIPGSTMSAVEVGGRPGVVLPRGPGEAAAATTDDVFLAVRAGAPLSWSGSASGPAANAACLYPLPHRTALRFVVVPPTAAVDAAAIDPAALPDAATVARGWTAAIDAAGRYELPDPGLSALVGAARARLVIAATALPARLVDGSPGSGVVLLGLAAGGHVTECRAILAAFADLFPARLADGPADAARALTGVAAAADVVGAAPVAEAGLGAAARLTSLVERSGDRAATGEALRALADLSESAGQLEAATHLRRRVTEAGGTAPRAGRFEVAGASRADRATTLDEVTSLAQAAAPAGRWRGGPAGGDPGSETDGGESDRETDRATTDREPDGAESDSAPAAARFWLTVRHLLLDERPASAGAGGPGRAATEVALLPAFPAAWRGGALEVHGAPVAGRRLAFALRWHGYRPALLWEFSDADRATADDDDPRLGPLAVRCPGLDPAWRTVDASGEVLLAGQADEPPPAPEPGDSFG